MAIRVALAEDNAVSRRSFIDKAKHIPDWEIIFTAGSGGECIEALDALKVDMLPAVVFMDIEMPGINGIDAIALASTRYPNIFFIALTVFDDDDKIFEAIRAGARGYLLKQEEYPALRQAVTDVLELGGAPMSPAIARKALTMLGRTADVSASATTSMPEHLTPREKEVLQYTVGGWDAKRIASHLAISTLTVRKHIEHIYQKLHVQSKAEVISMAHKNNWQGLR